MLRKKSFNKDGVISYFKCFWEIEKDKIKEVIIGFCNMDITNDFDGNYFCEVIEKEVLV